jgi:hypothetical protein
LSVGFDHLATFDDEVDLTVGLLECNIGVAPFGQWRRCPLFVFAVVVVLATSLITSVAVMIIAAIITTITSVAPVGAIVTTVVIASIVAAVVAAC